jgi:hypothetical protein
MSTPGLVEEALALADAKARSGNASAATPGNNNQRRSSHGAADLDNVRNEAQRVVAGDLALEPAFKTVLTDLLQDLNKDPLTQSHVAPLRPLAYQLRVKYLAWAHAGLLELIFRQPNKQRDLWDFVGRYLTFLSDTGWAESTLRARGLRLENITTEPELQNWLEAFEQVEAPVAVLVPLQLGDLQADQLTALHGIELVDEVPGLRGFGPGVRVARVSELGVDPLTACTTARTRLADLVNTAGVFLARPPALERAPVVYVEEEGTVTPVDVMRAPPYEERFSNRQQVDLALRAVWSTRGEGLPEAIFDAMRLRHRAIATSDPETRLVLLWFGIERLVAGSAEHGTIRASIVNLVPKCITFGKTRRVISDLCGRMVTATEEQRREGLLDEVGAVRDQRGRRVLDRERVLARVLGDDGPWEKMLAPFYDIDPNLVLRLERLRKHFRGESGDHIGNNVAADLKRSCEGVEWQVLRLYRARNGVAHAGAKVRRLDSLIAHAHFYLTNLVSIAVNYTSTTSTSSPAAVLEARCGQYDAWMALLRAGDPQAVTPANLLRPTNLLPMSLPRAQHP